MIVYLSLGANLGNREETLEQALQMLSAEVGILLRRSHYYYSDPVGFVSEHTFCNICAAYQTSLTPTELLDITQQIERQLGRTTKSINGIYHDRTIDIDLIRMMNENGDEIMIQNDRLTIPHPHYQKRDFVLIPLGEIITTQNE